MSGSEQLSREELLALIDSQAAVIEKLTVRVAELERQLGRNSRKLLAAAVGGRAGGVALARGAAAQRPVPG